MSLTIQQETYGGIRMNAMKGFEWRYLAVERFLPTLYPTIRRKLLEITRHANGRLAILDVGGRKSHYTIGVPADITISDLPRESSVQQQLHLGINNEMVSQLRSRRSNITDVQYDDMTRSSFDDQKFDCVVAIEVLEHVAEDAEFVREVHRVLKPGGVFLMTTPNGEFVENTNPDHKRHYKREQLISLLGATFESVRVEYAVRSGFFYNLALQSWSLKRPVRTVTAMLGAAVNSVQSAAASVRRDPSRTQELIAVAKKA